MNFELSETQIMIRDTARQFAQDELAPSVIERDEKEEFPHEAVKKLGELGFMGMMVPEQYGGAGLDTVSYVLALEEISKVDASTGVIMSVNNSLVCYGLNAFGTEDQKERYLKPLATGKYLGAFALSEPEAGSDATNQQTTAVKDGDDYIINGTKNFITNGSTADVILVMASTNKASKSHGVSTLIVEKNNPGLSVAKKEKKLGIRSSDTVSLAFQDCRVPASNMIGNEGFGFKFAMRTLDGGRIGRVTSFNLQENIAWYHFAHSYVRGNWRNSALSSPSILAKSVHDLDILYWLGGAPAESLVSMGDLSWFREENAPAGAPDRCLQGCPHAGTCPWYAPDLYLTENTGWPTSVISDDQSLPARRQVLETGPYGRCVYHCDNDVADHQDVLIRFKNGISAAFSMNALTYGKTRVIQATGSEGEIIGDLDEGWLEVRSFLHGEKERIRMGASVGGHNGGDVGLMHDVARIFGRADCGEAQADTGGISASRSSIEASLEGHWMAFAAEESRKKGIFVDLDAYRDMVSTRETVNI